MVSATMVILYPDNATMCATPVVLKLSCKSLGKPSFAPMVMPPKKAECGSGTALSMADKNLFFNVNNFSLTQKPFPTETSSACG